MRALSLRTLGVVLLCGIAAARTGFAADGDRTAGTAQTSILTDGIDIDRLLLDANSSDPTTRAAATEALKEVRKQNPTGKRHLHGHGFGLDLPSWQWDYDRKLGIDGIVVNYLDNDGGTAEVLVDYLPGLSKVIVGNVTRDLPKGAKITKAPTTSFGQFSGRGTRVTVLVTAPDPEHADCFLFYPTGPMEGCYLFTLLTGVPEPAAVRKAMATIVQSIHQE
jgi:hypothetical protein